VIPAIIRKCVEAKENASREVVLWGDGSPTRESLYVEDAAEGLVLAAECYDGDDPVKLGSGQEIRIQDLAETIANEVGFTRKIVWDTTKPNGQPRRCLDVSRANEAQYSFQEGLRKTISWYLAQQQSARERPLTWQTLTGDALS
jgi:GDP-L-fucose synthase